MCSETQRCLFNCAFSDPILRIQQKRRVKLTGFGCSTELNKLGIVAEKVEENCALSALYSVCRDEAESTSTNFWQICARALSVSPKTQSEIVRFQRQRDASENPIV